MGIRSLSYDDLMDVVELTDKLEGHIHETLKGNEHFIAISALITAAIHTVFGQCQTMKEVFDYRDAIMDSMQQTIKVIQLNNKDTSL